MMNYYTRKDGAVREADCETPAWRGSYDVIVAGGGSGGVYAALAAAREGKRVLLLEKSRWCGGQHVQGLVNGYYYGVRGGLYTQTDKQAQAEATDIFYDTTSDGKRIVIAGQLKKSGVEVRTLFLVTAVYTQGKTVCGVRVLLHRQEADLSCKMLIDAASDGHILRMLPIKLTMGRSRDGEPQPFSSVRSVYLDQMKYDGGLSVTVGDMGSRYKLFHEYRDNGYICQYDAEALTRAILRAHASHLKFMGEQSRFLFLSPIIGLREGVLYEGEDYLTLDDVLHSRVRTDNLLLWCFSDVDKHGSGIAFDDEIYQNWFACSNMSTCTVYIPVPVGAVVPKGWKGLTTAGRCISSDTYVNSAIRMNTDCFRIGEAVGTLSALATGYGQDPMAVPGGLLRSKLIGYGFFDEPHTYEPSFWNPGMRPEDRKFVSWTTDPAELRKALSTDCPAVALWSCYLAGKERLGDAVYEMSWSGDEMLRRNVGIALGLMRDERALPILHEIIRDRNTFYYMDCRRSNQMRSVIAICFCGQMRDGSAVDELLPILRPEEFERPMYHELLTPDYKRTITKEQNSVYFQHMSHTVVALTKIALAHPERRDEIRNALYAALDDGAYIRRMTDTPEWNAFYSAAKSCQDYVNENLG